MRPTHPWMHCGHMRLMNAWAVFIVLDILGQQAGERRAGRIVDAFENGN